MIFYYYIILLFLTDIFSYSFVDPNFPYHISTFLEHFVFFNRGTATIIYSLAVLLLFLFYSYLLWQVKNNKLSAHYLWKVIIASSIILFFSFPAFSYDIFNYIATAKVTYHYKENPYIVMPIEIKNDPMLAFMHAPNKTALYGPVWILLTAVPYFLGFGNIFLSVFTFKAFILIFYFLLAWFIFIISGKNKWSLAFFALNPLVLLESLVSSHNDVVMMFFAVLSFYFLKKKKKFFAFAFLVFSILIKLATLLIVPVFVFILYKQFRNNKIEWEKIWTYCTLCMFFAFFYAPIREEIYSWYFIWPLSFIALSGNMILAYIAFGFSFGLPLRFAPFIYTREWYGMVPLLKTLVTFIPPALTGSYYEIKKKIF